MKLSYRAKEKKARLKLFSHIGKKLKSRSGMTLLELIIAMFITVFIVILASSGVGVAANVYRNSVFVSESDILSATLNTTISDMLRYASSVECEDPDNPLLMTSFESSYYNESRGSLNIILSEEGRLQCEYVDTGVIGGSKKVISLCPEGAYTSGMKITDFKIEFDNTRNIFTGTYKIISENSALTRDIDFKYRALIIKNS